MRTYAPADVASVLAEILDEPSLARGVLHHAVEPAPAAGKSLCYGLPVLQALADDPSARALWLFPTKALGEDQVVAFRELAAAAGLPVAASTYDGATPAPVPSRVRGAG